MRKATLGVAQDHDGWRGCNLERAVLDGADLRGLKFRPETVFPEGFDADSVGASVEIL